MHFFQEGPNLLDVFYDHETGDKVEWALQISPQDVTLNKGDVRMPVGGQIDAGQVPIGMPRLQPFKEISAAASCIQQPDRRGRG